MKAFFDHWGNFSSVIGLVVSTIGFFWTLIIVWKSKTAAQRAEEAASAMKEALLKYESLTNCSNAISIIEEIRTFHREAEWDKSLYRYSRLTPVLLGLKADRGSFSEKDMGVIAGMIKQVAGCEKEVDKIRMDSKYQIKADRLNEILSTQVRKLHELLSNLKIHTKQEQQ
jgi:hypothetical protein